MDDKKSWPLVILLAICYAPLMLWAWLKDRVLGRRRNGGE